MSLNSHIKVRLLNMSNRSETPYSDKVRKNSGKLGRWAQFRGAMGTGGACRLTSKPSPAASSYIPLGRSLTS